MVLPLVLTLRNSVVGFEIWLLVGSAESCCCCEWCRSGKGLGCEALAKLVCLSCILLILYGELVVDATEVHDKRGKFGWGIISLDFATRRWHCSFLRPWIVLTDIDERKFLECSLDE